MNRGILQYSIIMILLTCCCSPGLQPDRMNTLKDIKRYARHGQEVKSQGTLTEKTGEREFVVTDNQVSLKINLGAYKKESKFLEENTRIVFSGTYRKKLFAQPEIEIHYLQVIEGFR